jgi:hypothetical protein
MAAAKDKALNDARASSRTALPFLYNSAIIVAIKNSVKANCVTREMIITARIHCKPRRVEK